MCIYSRYWPIGVYIFEILANKCVYIGDIGQYVRIYSRYWPICVCIFEILANICIAIIFKTGLKILIFENNFIYLIEPFFLHV